MDVRGRRRDGTDVAVDHIGIHRDVQVAKEVTVGPQPFQEIVDGNAERHQCEEVTMRARRVHALDVPLVHEVARRDPQRVHGHVPQGEKG